MKTSRILLRISAHLFAIAVLTLNLELHADTLLKAGVISAGTNNYPYTNKPAAGSQINWSRNLSSNLVSVVPVYEGAGTNFYDAATQLSYPAMTLSGTPGNAMPPTWFTPSVSTNYPWAGPAISNNAATAQSIVSPLQESSLINNVTNGYSYAELMQPLDTTTFGRIMDATGPAIIASYLNIPGRNGLVSTTWRDATDSAINPVAPFTVNQWLLVLFTVQQGLGVMYINGVQVASSSNVNLGNSWSGQIGPVHYNTTGGSNPGTQMCNANFSSWWVWNNRVLTAQEAAQLYANPWAMFYTGAQKGFIKGTRLALTNLAAVSNVFFYSHVAAGNARLALYTNSSPKALLWQSGVISNTASNDWLVAPISAGTPGNLILLPGTYWLAWQVDTTYDAPSYAAGAVGDGFYLSQPFGNFPASLAGEQTSSETWSGYFNYASPAPAQFAGIERQTDGNIQLQLNGSTNIPYGLLTSTNLAAPAWLRISVPAAISNGMWFFTDTNIESSAQRFYRAVWP
jgi:hypothetical protein